MSAEAAIDRSYGVGERGAEHLDGPARDTDAEASAPRGAVPITVAVVGLGGIGAVAAGYLAAAGRHRVVACARRPLDRLVIERPEGVVEVALRALADPRGAGPVDWVLLCTKAHQTPSAAPWLSRLCHAATRVAVLQNGVGQVARTAPWVGAATVVPTVVSYSGERFGDDRVVLRQPASFDLAVADDDAGRDLAALFVGTPLRIELSDDLRMLSWRKLIINSVANPITALTFRRLAVFRRSDVADLAASLLEEAAAVARADGVPITDADVVGTLSILRNLPADMTTSMHFDRLAGRLLEFDALNGTIVATGRRLGVPTPLNSALLTLLRAAGGEETAATTEHPATQAELI